MKDKYRDLAGELKMLRNMKVMMIPIVVGALGIFPKAWKRDREIGGKAKTIQTPTALLRSTRILRRDYEI